MKIGLALASADALPTAFVVMRDNLCRCVDRCAALGYVFASDHLYFTHPDVAVRQAAVERVTEMIRLAAEMGAKVNNGYVTAEILPEPDPDSAAKQAVLFLRARLSAISKISDSAAALLATIIPPQ